MEKVIDLTKSIKEICALYPDVVNIMKNIGFDNIANPVMLNTAGRFMTIPNGAKMKNIDMELIKEEFTKNGYTLK